MIEFRKLAKRGDNVDKRKTIIVWMDGKKTKITKNKKVDRNEQPAYFARETAATKEDTGQNDPIPTYVRQNTLENEVPYKKGKKQNGKTYKQIFISAISAIVLGVGLGLLMLYMFTGIDNNSIGNPATEKTSGQPNNSGDGVAAADVSTYPTEGLEAFVLQAGIFNDESNLKVVQDKFSQAGFLTMVWKRDNQYFLFANVGKTKDQTDTKKVRYKELGLDTYAKKWSTGEAELELTKAEHEWLQNFDSLFTKSLKSVSTNKSIPSTDWNEWIESYPAGGEKTKSFHEQVKGLQKDVKDANETTSPIILLKLWNQFETSILK